ncbi:MAG: Slp/YeaY family lipoprotein [Wenzhouxiangella sp.]|jgi:outer membrane lipoprotein|nr:Slp/YeaY family lipoprotein [Wenzhouxiangella sp.]
MNGFAIKLSIAALGLGLLGGCASIPAPLAGDYPEFQPEQANERSVGARVRWGGEIIETRPQREQTCVEVLAKELGTDYRPRAGDLSFGRFLACKDGFHDPAVFTAGRGITVIGTIDGFTDATIGDFLYRYPRVEADTLYLWDERPDYAYHDPWRYHGPWWSYGYYRWYPWPVFW